MAALLRCCSPAACAGGRDGERGGGGDGTAGRETETQMANKDKGKDEEAYQNHRTD